MHDATVDLEKAAADIPLTRSAREVLDRAAAMAAARGLAAPEPMDVLQAILEMRGTLASQALSALGVDPGAVSTLARFTDASGGRPLPIRQLLVNANREAMVLGHYQVDSIHLLLALLYSDSPATSAALQKAGLTLYDLRRHLQTGAKPDAPAAVPAGGSRPDAALRRKPMPSLKGVLGVSPVFLGLVGATAVSGAALWFGIPAQATGVVTIVFVVAGWITSVCIHEFGHALVAYVGGDRSVASSGYLTLDPLRYTNVLLSLVMPIVFLLLGGIGLPGGAVYINRAALRSRTWDSAVSLAGPAGTLVCGLAVAMPFLVPGHETWITATNLAFFEALAFLGFVEVVALVLNLVPIPGLDGFGVIRPWLPHSAQDLANRFGMTAIILVFLLLWYVAPVRDTFFQTIFQITGFLGIDPALVFYGQAHMRLV